MRTAFRPQQLADPEIADCERAIRSCVHCGFCTATCPTYVLLGDERDSPRGRIGLIQSMLETGGSPTANVVAHIDRCLSCLACTSTCPSGVDYRQLIDHARNHVEATYRRSLMDRWMRAVLAAVVPHRQRFAAALGLGRLAGPIAAPLAQLVGAKRIAAMLSLARTPTLRPPDVSSGPTTVSTTATQGRVLIPGGCVEPSLRPTHQAATERLLKRFGYEIVSPDEEACCGAVEHHMGRESPALAGIRRNVDDWTRIEGQGGLAAIVVVASGCASMVKDYGRLLRHDPIYAERAARISSLTHDISKLLTPEQVSARTRSLGLRVAWQAPCSQQHGQKLLRPPVELLRAAGFSVITPAEAHLCCGSAGAYAILQPEISERLGRRKASALDALKADVIATANIGCDLQLSMRASTPVLHIAELLDWATGGPTPPALTNLKLAAKEAALA